MMKLSYSFLLAFVTIASQNIATLTAFQQLLSPTTSIPTRLHSKQQLKSTTSSNNNNIDIESNDNSFNSNNNNNNNNNKIDNNKYSNQ